MNQFRFKMTILISVATVALLLLITRLVDIQLVRGSMYANQSDDNRFYTVRIPPERGIFLDRFDQPLVWNKRTYARRTDSDALHSGFEPIDQLTALNALATHSASIQFGLERQYRYPQSLAHILGYVGAVTADDLLNDRLLAVSDLIGKSGLEKKFDSQLRGQAGREVYEINAMGQRQRLVEKKDGIPGQAITTSLDPYLSETAWQALGENTGVVIIQDAETGEIISLVSKPGFDASALSTSYIDPVLESQRRQQVSQLFSDDSKPFFNRAVGGVYPPGSVFKLVTAIGGLEADAVEENTQFLDEGILKVGEFEYANWYFTQFGRTEGDIGLRRAIARSNDIYFYKAAELLGPVRLAEYARLFGFGSPTDIELQQEASGTVPDPAWKEKVIGEPWYLGNTFHMGIGQGDVLVTPLQVAQMTQAFGNHGTLCRPTVLKTKQLTTCGELGISDEHMEIVLAGMIDVCSVGGTAFPFFPHNEKYVVDRETGQSNQLIDQGAIACKTGTAEFGGADEKGYRKTHGWFTSVIGTQPIKDLAARVAAGEQVFEEGVEVDEKYLEWLTHVHEKGYPNKLVMVSLVESDEDVPFKEGSQHAAPIIKAVVDWMMAN
jgi:penicillin-binding protein 2